MSWILNGTTNSVEWKCRAVIERTDYSIANNQSTIKVTFQWTRARSSSYGSNGATNYNITADGQSKNGTRGSYNYSYIGVDDWKEIGVQWFDVYHNADGSKRVNVSCRWTQSGVQPNSCNISGAFDLPTIPRASSVTCNDGNIGSATTINISRASSSFTHTLTYNFSGLTGTIATKTSNTSIGWTIPTSFYAKIPSSKVGTVTITCYTYDANGNQVSTGKTCTANCFVVNSEPTASAIVKDVNAITVRVTENDQVIVRGLSNARVQTTATGKNSATIKSIVVTCVDKNGSGADTTINKVASNVFTIKVTDSRGFITSITKTLTLINYVEPAITELNITRVETTAPLTKISVRGLWWGGNFGVGNNTRALLYYWKLSGTTAWSAPIQLSPTNVSGNNFSYDANLAEAFDPNNSYDFLVRIQDRLMEFDKTVVMGKAVPLITGYKNKFVVNENFEVGGSILYPQIKSRGSADGASVLRIVRENGTELAYVDAETNGQGLCIHLYDGAGNWIKQFSFQGSGLFESQYIKASADMTCGNVLRVIDNIYLNNNREFKGWAFTNSNTYWLGLSGDDTYFRMYNTTHNVMNGVTYSGSPSGRWIKVYSTQADDISSDRRKKENIMAYGAELETFFDLLKPVSYTLINGHTGRKHLGFIAQDVEEAMTQAGMSYKDLAFLQKAPMDANGEEIDPGTITNYEADERIADYDYSLAYTELIALNTHMIQSLKKEIEALKAEIATIKGGAI